MNLYLHLNIRNVALATNSIKVEALQLLNLKINQKS